jgi:hypothetical protein
MEDQLALFIRWRIFFSSFLGVVLDAMNNSCENSWVRTCKRAFALAQKHARSVRTQASSFLGVTQTT